MKNKKWLIAVVAIVVVGALFWGWRYTQRANEQAALEEAALNSTVSVRIQDIEDTIYTSGTIVLTDAETVFTSSGGVVSEVMVQEGSIVTKGQILAKLSNDDLNDQLAREQLSFNIAENNYQQALLDAQEALTDAEDNLKQKQDLYAVYAISKRELDDAQEQYDQALENVTINTADSNPTSLEIKYLQYRQSKLSINELYAEIASNTIRSPIAGAVTLVNLEETKYVSSKAVAFEVGDLGKLQIQATVGEYEVNKLSVGMSATVFGDAFNQIYQGEISNIAAAATKSGSETVVAIVIDILNETSELKPNFTANADIVIDSAQQAMVVPLDAVVTMPNGSRVVRKKVGTEIVPIQVQTGVANDLYIQIISDEIQEGDEVISASNMGLTTGDGTGLRPGAMTGNRLTTGGK